ncbi:MAG: radical SAM protein [Candidatus Omnitrophica bacterium]|nr:radical SAM protein [Candidatus Omnitrophota bacterium]
MINKINHVWLFFTDRCNLGCGYCFYKHRTRQEVMDIGIFKHILEFVRSQAPLEFIFSGGEPLIEADLLREMITRIKNEKLDRYISVQTNATLLNNNLMKFFLDNGINLEVGIDGKKDTTIKNRPGIEGGDFDDIVHGVNLAVSSKGPLTATMTVRPQSVDNLFENLKYLASIGLRSIEVHPAFLENWDKSASKIFLDLYRESSLWELKEKRYGLIGRGYSKPSTGIWDMLALPNGKVLGNWVLLSFPEEVRKDFYLMDFGLGPSGQFLKGAKSYFTDLSNFIARNPQSSYRAVSNFNARKAVETKAGSCYKSRVNSYIELCEQIEQIDRKMLILYN